jgi:hypothetical protein
MCPSSDYACIGESRMQSTYTSYMPTSIVDAEGFIRRTTYTVPIECLHCSQCSGPSRRPPHLTLCWRRLGPRRVPVRKKKGAR